MQIDSWLQSDRDWIGDPVQSNGIEHADWLVVWALVCNSFSKTNKDLNIVT